MSVPSSETYESSAVELRALARALGAAWLHPSCRGPVATIGMRPHTAQAIAAAQTTHARAMEEMLPIFLAARLELGKRGS